MANTDQRASLEAVVPEAQDYVEPCLCGPGDKCLGAVLRMGYECKIAAYSDRGSIRAEAIEQCAAIVETVDSERSRHAYRLLHVAAEKIRSSK